MILATERARATAFGTSGTRRPAGWNLHDRFAAATRDGRTTRRHRAVIVGAEHVSFSAILTLAHVDCRAVAMVTPLPRHQSYGVLKSPPRRCARPGDDRRRRRRDRGRRRVEQVVLTERTIDRMRHRGLHRRLDPRQRVGATKRFVDEPRSRARSSTTPSEHLATTCSRSATSSTRSPPPIAALSTERPSSTKSSRVTGCELCSITMYDAAWERAAVGRTKIWLKPFGRLAPTRKSLPNLASTKAVGQRDSHAWMRDPGARTGGRPMPLTEILVTNSSYTSSGRLRGRLIRAGLKEARCEVCGLTEWRGRINPVGARSHRRKSLEQLTSESSYALSELPRPDGDVVQTEADVAQWQRHSA